MSGEKGGVPEGWQTIDVGAITLWHKQGYYSKEEYSNDANLGTKLIRITDLGNPSINIENSPRVMVSQKDKSEFAVRKGDFLIARSGAIGRYGISEQDYDAIFASYIINFRFNEKIIDTRIFGYIFESTLTSQLLNTVQGSSNQNVNAQNLKKMILLLPPLPEQRKIAAILSTWDDSLATLTNLLAAKRQQKRGLAEALLTGKKRLPGFEGEWEEKKLGEVFTRITRKNTEGNEHALTISGTLGLIDQREFFNKRVAAADLSGYYLIRRGEFAYNKSYSAGYDFGAIKRLNRYGAGVVSTLYICFALAKEDAVSDFYEQFFEAGLLNEGISGIAQEGARNHGLLNVSAKDFFELTIPFPLPDEQQAIASILSTLDAEIASLEALRAKVQEQKRGLMDELLTGRVRVKVDDA